MKLEDAIKQKAFRDEYHKATVNVIYTGNWLNANMSKYLKEYDLSPQQYNVLRILRGQYPNTASVNLIIDRMLDKMSNASRLVEKLRQKELVERKECPQDRRQVDVKITEKGLQILEVLDKKFEEWNHIIRQKLSTQDALLLNELLDKLRS